MRHRFEPLGSRDERVRADVCIVGAGVAGLIAATRIAARGDLNVVVIESGRQASDPPLAELDRPEGEGSPYHGPRARGVGGTSALWAGKLLPLSAHDLGARPHLGLDAWPLGPERLDAYLAEVEAMMHVDVGSYDQADDPALDPHGLLPAFPDLRWRWPKKPRPRNYRVDRVLRHQIARRANLTIWTDATVTALAAAEGRLASVTAVNAQGGRMTVTATRFVLAAGTLETTRLLLLADRQNDGCISRTTDALGRYFNDHLGVEVALVRPVSMRWLNRAVADRRVNGTMRHVHGELSAERQRAAGVASAYFDFDAKFLPTAVSERFRTARSAARQGAAKQVARALTGIAANPVSLSREVVSRSRYGRQHWSSDSVVGVKIWIEQLPVRDNRLTLSDRSDVLGSPRLRVDLRPGDTDRRTMDAAIGSLAALWSTRMAPYASLDWTILRSHPADAAVDQAHPAGSARMGHDPSSSVVDPSLRVHALPNVSVASAAVFPSSGSVNPTLTIMQLAMLAADGVLKR